MFLCVCVCHRGCTCIPLCVSSELNWPEVWKATHSFLGWRFNQVFSRSLCSSAGAWRSSPRRGGAWRSSTSCLAKSPTTVGYSQSQSPCCSQPPRLLSQPLLPRVTAMIQDSFVFYGAALTRAQHSKIIIEKLSARLQNHLFAAAQRNLTVVVQRRRGNSEEETCALCVVGWVFVCCSHKESAVRRGAKLRCSDSSSSFAFVFVPNHSSELLWTPPPTNSSWNNSTKKKNPNFIPVLFDLVSFGSTLTNPSLCETAMVCLSACQVNCWND